MKPYELFIGGTWVAPRAGGRFDAVNPFTGKTWAQLGEADASDVDAAVTAAAEAQPGWAATNGATRALILNRIADVIVDHASEMAVFESTDNGKVIRETSSQMLFAARLFRFFAGYADKLYGSVIPLDNPHVFDYTRREPYGVIALITAWNSPITLLCNKLPAALAAGNTVVVKPSEETPLTTTLLGEVMNAVGVPKGVYNVVHGFGPDSAGAYLTEHPGVDAITFTGETQTGEVITRAAAKGLRQVSMECGGKNAGIVFADCDIDKAVEGTMRSAFANCGQVCFGTERVYVERPIFEEFVARMKAGAEGLKLGAPEAAETTMGPLISNGHKEKVLSYYKLAEEEGATIVTGGGSPDMGDLNGGAWVQPTIWTGLTDDARVIREEIFGPCCHIAPFDSEDEVIVRANDTKYGLVTAIWTEDLSRAHRVARQIDVGIVWVNSWFLRDLRTAFGGAKASGIGREGGVHGLEFYSELSNVCVKL